MSKTVVTMNSVDKIKVYRKLMKVLKYIKIVSFTFVNSERKIYPSFKCNIVKAALEDPDFFGVNMTMNCPLVDETSNMFLVKFLVDNNLKNNGDKKLFSFKQFFEYFLPGVSTDVKKYQRVLLDKLDNDHFHIRFRINNKCKVDAVEIVRELINNGYRREVQLVKTCMCSSLSPCETVRTGQISYTKAFEIMENVPAKKTQFYNLESLGSFPVTTYTKRQFYSFS